MGMGRIRWKEGFVGLIMVVIVGFALVGFALIFIGEGTRDALID